MNDHRYIGGELGLFARATNWKSYFRKQLQPYLHGEVLEVGAGIGGTTRILCDGTQSRWICLEPDAEQVVELESNVRAAGFPIPVDIRTGTVGELPEGMLFDAILYIDVLEHIQEDRAELEQAARRLRPGGTLAVLSPAHQFLYSPFDAALGHCRRYNRASLQRAGPTALRLERLRYLDSVGMLLSLGNRLLLRQKLPTESQIQFWDRFCVPCSRWLDRLLGWRVGKSIYAVWRREPHRESLGQSR